jgi:O-antigen/teichoic acid export membrane protein
MLSIFIQLSQTMIDGGFNLALIQKEKADEEDYSSVFYINLSISLILYALLFVIAPYIARFYQQPTLTILTRVLSLIFVFNAFSYVQEARLRKELRFKTLMFVHIPSTIIGGLTSVLLAWLGFGVWSLVAMQVLTRFFYSVQIWIYSKWRPLLYFNRRKAYKLFSFGGKLFVSRIFTTLYNNMFLVIIGKFYPVNNVGFYQNAFNLSNTPSSTLTSVLGSVTFPVFSTIQNDLARLKVGYKKAMQQVFFWVCPIYVFAGVLAEPIFEVLFTKRWLPAVPYFQWLCIVAIVQPLTTYNLNIVNVRGRSDLFLKLQSIRRVITIAAIAIVFPLGIHALLVVQAASSIFAFLLFSYYAGRFINYGLMEQLTDICPILILSIGVGALLFGINFSLAHVNPVIKVALGFGTGVTAYWLVSKNIGLDAFKDFENIVKTKINKRKLTVR